ncbi:MAG: hypothetical protein ACLTCI_00335 [[Clostridium] nexile]
MSLITFMALFTMGVRKSYERKVEHMQHVIYYDVTKEQLGNLAKDEQVSCVAKMKTGPSIEVEDYILSFQYMEESRKELEMLKLSEGKMPQKEDEIAVPKSYLKRIGKPESLERSFLYFFRWNDGDIHCHRIFERARKVKYIPLFYLSSTQRMVRSFASTIYSTCPES